MFEPEGYPAGSYNDPRAPWNEKISFEAKEAVVTGTLLKDIYIKIREGSTDKKECLDSFITSNYSPLLLIEKFKLALEYYKDNNTLPFSPGEIDFLINNCKGWGSETIDIDI